MDDVDLVVVGAGPAGAAAAIAARRTDPGLRVLLLDRADFPRDKACGDGIAPHAVDVLAALGARHVLHGYRPVLRLTVSAPSGASASGALRQPDWVIPRSVFDARLVAEAVRAGATLRRHRVRRVAERRDGVVVDGQIRAQVLVAADGANSSVRRALGLAANPPEHCAVAIRGYAAASHRDQRIVMDAANWPGYAWSFPVGAPAHGPNGHAATAGEAGRLTANVGYGALRSRLDGGRAALVDRLRAVLGDDAGGLDPSTLVGHLLPLSTRRPPPALGRVLLAGDAASLINPLSGEGIYYALASGALAGRAAADPPPRAAADSPCIAAADPTRRAAVSAARAAAGPAHSDATRRTAADPGRVAARYRRDLDALLRRHHLHTRALAWALGRPLLAEAGVAAAARSQQAFDDLCELTLGAGVVSPALAVGVVRRLGAAVTASGATATRVGGHSGLAQRTRRRVRQQP